MKLWWITTKLTDLQCKYEFAILRFNNWRKPPVPEAPKPEPVKLKKYSDKYLEQQKELQDRCNHLKGGRHKRFGGPKDYILTQHRFPNGQIKIWCQLCQKQFDPKAEVTREMLKQTTNSLSSSEVRLQIEKPKPKVNWEPIFKKRFLEVSGLFDDSSVLSARKYGEELTAKIKFEMKNRLRKTGKKK